MDGVTAAESGMWTSRMLETDDIKGIYDAQNGTSFREHSRSHQMDGQGTERIRLSGASRVAPNIECIKQQHGRFPRISRPVELMRDSYDVVVIGSGYGGGVAVSRMARGKQSVCVLERGKERWPGEFPEKFEDALKELHVRGEFAPGDRRSVPGTVVDKGNPNGLYQFVVGDGQNVYMGNGLGGTSLLNANVFLESHPKVLDMEIWPEELRGRNARKKCE